MMDARPLYPKGYHPVQQDFTPDSSYPVTPLSRAHNPVRYYYIDFGLSIKFSPGQDTTCQIVYGGDRSAPEYNNPSGLYSPFYLDIYTLANMIREEFSAVSYSYALF